MKPIEFKGCNITYAKNQPEYLPLPAMKKRNGDITTVWELTSEEIAEIIATKRIYIHVMTFNHKLQPLRPYTSMTEPHIPYFRTKAEIIEQKALEECEAAYHKTVEVLKEEGAEDLVEQVGILVAKDGALKTWLSFDFEEKCSPEDTATFKLAFEYMELMAEKKSIITENP